MDTISLPWEQVQKLTKVLAMKLRPILPKHYQLYCISRGGFIAGGMLAYELGTPKIEVIGGCHPAPGVAVLIVDGICDTGEEMKFHYGWIAPPNHTGHVICATLIRRSTAAFQTISAYTHEGDEWFHFPWEPEEEKVDPREQREGSLHDGGAEEQRPPSSPPLLDPPNSPLSPGTALPDGVGEVRPQQLAEGDTNLQSPGSLGEPPPTLEERGSE